MTTIIKLVVVSILAFLLNSCASTYGVKDVPIHSNVTLEMTMNLKK